jgi:membrane-bound serine protease (ClpP class)
VRGADDASVAVLTATGVVDNVFAGYVEEGIARANRDGATAVVIRLDTPGGSVDATRRIVTALLDAPLPTIVWVAPSGARAASAGTFITLAGHVALMAPGTNIGAASPVGGGGEDIEGTLGEKVRQDTLALMRAIADERGRDRDWAVSTVEDAIASTATEAVEVGAVDGIADSLDEVLAFADERVVRVNGTDVTVTTAGAATYDLAMNPFQAFLHLLSDANIALILFTIGFYGLLYEVISPNFVTGILGAIAMVLAFIGFGSLPLNVGGLLLIGLGILMFLLEFHVVSHGLLTVAGIVCFALGASALYTAPGDSFEPLVGVATPVIVIMSVTTAICVGLVSLMAMRTRRMTGPGLVTVAPGAQAIVRRPLDPLGSVHLAGEEWTARSASDQPIERGTPVRVVGVDGLTVLVEPDPQPSQA